FPSDPDDHAGRAARRRPADARLRRGFGAPAAAGDRRRRRPARQPGVDAVHDAGDLPDARSPLPPAARRRSARGLEHMRSRASVFVFAGLAACASSTPRPLPENAVPRAWEAEAATQTATSADAAWWRVFGDPVLD